MNPQLYWTLPGLIDTLVRTNADGTNPETLLNDTQLSNPNGIALDLANGHVYIVDGGAGDRILRADLDGSNVRVIVADAGDNPADIALDLANGRIYWTIPGITDQVRRANLDGSNVETILDATSLNNPNGIALDGVNGYLYIADGGAGDRILRTDLDGSNVEVIVSDAGNNPADIALDLVNGQLYWTIPGATDQVRRANLDGSNLETILDTRVLENPNGIALDLEAGHLYLADGGAGDVILRANLDGSNVEMLPIEAGDNPTGLALAIADSDEAVSLSALLSGTQEIPLFNGSDVTGVSTLGLNAAGDALSYSVTLSGVDFGALLGTDPQTPDPGDDVIRLHLHAGARGESGPVALDLFALENGVVGGQDADDFTLVVNADGTVTFSGIWETSDPSLINLSEVVADIRNAVPGEDLGLYWNIHTDRFPGGEVRGQIQQKEAPTAGPVRLTVAVENLAPDQGAIVTPLWFGLHDGSFNTFDAGAPASPAVEIVAEEGFIGLEGLTPDFPSFAGTGFDGIDLTAIPILPLTISSQFASSPAGERGLQGIIAPDESPLGIFPGQQGSRTLTVFDPASSRFFSYAAMVFPSNDAFVGDVDPIELFDAAGNFIGANLTVFGDQVWDAGTEVNDEAFTSLPFSAAGVLQGTPEGGVIERHPGLLPPGSGGIVDIPGFANADFRTPGYEVARIQVFAEHLTPLIGNGGRNLFEIALNNTFSVENFGGVGRGAVPRRNRVAEIDTLRFVGEGLTAQNLLLTQVGDDLRLSFEGVPGTGAVLRNFALEDLDNLPSGEGNLLFDGDTALVDSFDVFDANAVRFRLFNRNSVTFLNDLDNVVIGFAHSDDVINAQGGDDVILGLSGDDRLRGGMGDDLLDGGLGSDRLTGGSGRDTFRFNADLLASDGGDFDVITDFEAGDRIDFSGFLNTGGQFSLAVLNDRLVANLSTGDTLTVLGNVQAASAELVPLATAIAIA